MKSETNLFILSEYTSFMTDNPDKQDKVEKTFEELLAESLEAPPIEIHSDYPDECMETYEFPPSLEDHAATAYQKAKEGAIIAGTAVKDGVTSAANAVKEYQQSGRMNEHYERTKGYASRGVDVIRVAAQKTTNYLRGLWDKDKKKEE